MLNKKFFELTLVCFISLLLRLASAVEEVRVNGGTCVILGTKCFQFVSVNSNWFQAAANCRRNRAHLLNIIDSYEMDLLSKYIYGNNLGTDRFWIDGNDLADEGTFLSTKTGNHLSFIKWRPGEPNNMHDAEHCLELHKGEKLTMNDHWCKERMFSICEHNILSSDLPAKNTTSSEVF